MRPASIVLFVSNVVLHCCIATSSEIPVCMATKYECETRLVSGTLSPPECVMETMKSDIDCGPAAADGCTECTSKIVSSRNRGFLCGAVTPAVAHLSGEMNMHYAADNSISMFVNGVRMGTYLLHWWKFASEKVALRSGDVVAFVAHDPGVWHGMIAAINYRGAWLGTGGTDNDEWRAIPASSYTGPHGAWMHASYDACSWPRPILRPRAGEIFPGKASDFPYASTGAQYVWAQGADRGGTILVRRVIDESCATVGAPINVQYAADKEIEMFVNGARRGAALDNWGKFASEAVYLRDGDVVAFVVKDFGFWFGMIAAVRHGGAWTSTGADQEWRAIRSTDYKGPRDAWKLPSFDACSWAAPIVRPGDGQVFPGKARSFPYAETGAKYVWAAGAGVRDTIFVRRVIGGRC